MKRLKINLIVTYCTYLYCINHDIIHLCRMVTSTLTKEEG